MAGDPRRSRFVAYALAASLLLVVATIALYVVLVIIPGAALDRLRQAGRGIAGDLDALFHATPQVQVNQTVIVTRTTPILELATVSEDRTLAYDWSHEWLGSTKLLHLGGRFRLRAGFDLRQPFDVEVTDGGAVVTLPPASLLTCELLTLQEQGDSGWWNHLSDRDREQARIGFLASARGSDEARALAIRAQQEAERQIGEIVRRHLGDKPVAFRYRSP